MINVLAFVGAAVALGYTALGLYEFYKAVAGFVRRVWDLEKREHQLALKVAEHEGIRIARGMRLEKIEARLDALEGRNSGV